MAQIMQKLIPKMATLYEQKRIYCTPPLAMERESVLDRYFDDITVHLIASEKEGQDRIANISGLWTRVEADKLKRNHN